MRPLPAWRPSTWRRPAMRPSAWRRPVLGLSAIGLTVLLLIPLGSGLERDPQRVDSPLVGRQAPTFRLVSLDGSVVHLGDHRGRPLIVNFWASWCIPCRDEAPLLERTRALHADDGLVVLGIVFQDDDESAAAFAERHDLRYPSLVDPDGRTAIDYGVFGVPETFFIDARGIIRSKHLGPLDRAILEREVERLLR